MSPVKAGMAVVRDGMAADDEVLNSVRVQ